MNKRWMAVATFCMGMASGPLMFQFGDSIFRAVHAEDPASAITPVREGTIPSETRERPARSDYPVGSPSGEKRAIQQGSPSAAFSQNGVRLFLDPAWGGVADSVIVGGGPLAADTKLAEPEKIFGSDTLGFTRRNVVKTSTAGNGIGCLTADSILFLTADGIVISAKGSVQVREEADKSDLATQYVKLSTQLLNHKLQRLTSQELATQVEALKTEVSNLDANRKLVEARLQLIKVMQDHPQSPAAQDAKRMLDAEAIEPAIIDTEAPDKSEMTD
jgi:hypothetical protein